MLITKSGNPDSHALGIRLGHPDEEIVFHPDIRLIGVEKLESGAVGAEQNCDGQV